jgi:signal transduction histidine kinase
LRVCADREKLEQILLNLLSNAVKFTPPGGSVRVEALPSPEDPALALLHVRDTGIGIPAGKLASVFEPFVQVDSSHTRGQHGSGLGLAISRDLARGMGGDLTAESTQGEGSTFTLALRAG